MTEQNSIITKIEEINEKFRQSKGAKDKIFSLLETHIKNIDNDELLENNYFINNPVSKKDDSGYFGDIFLFRRRIFSLKLCIWF